MNDWIERALEHASTLRGADAGASVIISEQSQTNLRWANNALTTNGAMHERTAQVVCLAEVQGGVASGCLAAPVSDVAELTALVERAALLAVAGEPDEDAAPLFGGGVDADFGEGPELGSIEVFTDLAAGLGRAFDAAGDHHLFFGFAEHTVTTTWIGTTAGTRRRAVTRTGRLEVNAKHPDMIGSAWVGRATQTFEDVDIDQVVAEVLQRLSWCENKIDLPAGKYDVILPGGALADLLIYLYWTMSGRDAREGSTVFSAPGGRTRIGEKLSELPIRMWSDPDAEGLQTDPFAATGTSMAGMKSIYDNGREVGAMDWLHEGHLVNLIETSHEQVTQGQPAMPVHWPTQNLLFDGGAELADEPTTTTIDDLVASTERGLLITCLWYIRQVDPQTLLLTGLTRDGVHLVEDGKVVGMVNNFRWNESPVELLGRITEVGTAERVLCREWNDMFTRTVMPPVKVSGFNMSTVSKAY